jgi:choline dehydrogenase-like flavoprotein
MEASEIYDFIVVGAGTAGCVIGERLSEDGLARVLIIEAGHADLPPAVRVPSAWPSLQGTSADWGGQTVIQSSTGTQIPWARGRGLGGSSAINALAFVRGHRDSYDAWKSAGAREWGFDELLPFFKRSEQAIGRDPRLRGLDGPLTVAPAAAPTPIQNDFLVAAADSGYSPAADITSGTEDGFGLVDLNVVDGQRQSAYDAYLAPAAGRPNLDIVTDALVCRLLYDGTRCTGIEYRTEGTMHEARCSTEVVLTAGATGSPQLMMLSGIGPASHLRDAGIHPLVDLPGVGENLFDHPLSGIIYSSSRPVPVTANPAGSHGETVGLTQVSPDSAGPDVQFVMLDVPIKAARVPSPAVGAGYTILTSLMLPRSRGSIRLASDDPSKDPLIDPNFYGDPADIDTLAGGLRAARTIGLAAGLDGWRKGEVQPGPGRWDDKSLHAYLKANLRTYHHPGGTCRIGDDEYGVVDSELRVRGVTGLRVADASVMPAPVSANTNATVYAIAERAASLLKR